LSILNLSLLDLDDHNIERFKMPSSLSDVTQIFKKLRTHEF